MKLKALLLLAVVAFTALLPRPAEARVEVSFDFFFDALSPHGEWIEVGDYGTCWRPSIADADWRPYSDGYWSYTDGGWTWVSYEEFGGIVYHYGRWVEVDGEGWCWVPDYEWAPAWVSWRTSDDYIGWAPLPPEARWRRNTGFSVWVDSYYDIGPARFNFCRVRDFGAPFLRPVIVNRFENVTIIQHTANVTNISYFDGGDFGGLVHCGGPSFGFINQRVLRPIPALKLVQKTQINNITNINVQNVNIFNAEPRGNALAVLVPRVTPPTAEVRRPQPARSIPAARIRKGWDGVKDPEVASVIRTRMQQESRGLTPETAPARKVQAAELKVLPAKVDTSAPSPVRTARERGNDTRRGEGAPAAIVQPTPQPQQAQTPATKQDPSKPVDARTAERMAREAARQPGQVPTPAVVQPPVPAEKPVAEQKKDKDKPQTSPASQTSERDARARQMTRSVPSAVPPGVAPAATSPDRSRTTSKASDEAAAARARAQAAAAEQERAATEQRLRAAAAERERAAEASMRRQKEAAAQQDAARERQRREMPAPTVRRVEPSEPPRPKSDDSGRKAAEAAIQRQRQMEAARSQQMENARREAAAENARRSQMESARREQASQQARQQQMEAARREQASQAARQQQMDAARREQAAQSARQAQMENARREAAQENARRAQMESARREQAAASARQAEASRQMEAARQSQQRAESMRREQAPQRYGPPPTRSESRDRSEEADAARKGRSR